MKKVLLLVLLLTVGLSFGQGKKTLKMISEIEGEWKLNENGHPFYEIIVNNGNLTKEQLYNNAYNGLYHGADEDYTVLTSTLDKINFKFTEQVHMSGYGNGTTYVSGVYNGKVEFKKDKFKITLTLIRWITNGGIADENINLTSTYPLKKTKEHEVGVNMYGKSFYKAHKKTPEILKSIKHFILNKDIETVSTW